MIVSSALSVTDSYKNDIINEFAVDIIVPFGPIF